MPPDLRYLEGKRICLVFMQGQGTEPSTVRLRALHGRASVDRRGTLAVEHAEGRFLVPSSCYPNILPADGSPILQDAEYFVICRLEGLRL